MERRTKLWLTTVGVVLQASLFAFPALGQMGGGGRAEKPPAETGQMMEACRQMMTERQAFGDEVKEMNAQLDQLVDRMQAATGEEKIDAMAATVTALAQQEKTLREKRMAMQSRMMAHMQEHMQAGMGGEKKPMMQCPMMGMMGSGMAGEGAADAPGTGAHEEHHPAR